MARPISTVPIYGCLERANVLALRVWLPMIPPETDPHNNPSFYRGETWSQQCAYTNMAVRKSLRWTISKCRRPVRARSRSSQYASGVNFIDTYFRVGMYPSPVGMPFVSGNEGAGEVTAVGPGVTDVKVGDRIAYVVPLGGYAALNVCCLRIARWKLPDNITYDQAAAMMLKGMTVQYLLNRTFKVGKGTIVLIHAAAGGVGLIACQWANHIGCNRDRHRRLQGQGRTRQEERRPPHHLYRDEDFVAKVKEITSGKLCDVVYDGIGKDTFPASLDCIRPAWIFRQLRERLGSDRSVHINLLQAKGSLFATRPTLNHYAAKREDLVATAKDLFEKVGSGAVEKYLPATNMPSRMPPRRTRTWKAAKPRDR